MLISFAKHNSSRISRTKCLFFICTRLFSAKQNEMNKEKNLVAEEIYPTLARELLDQNHMRKLGPVFDKNPTAGCRSQGLVVVEMKPFWGGYITSKGVIFLRDGGWVCLHKEVVLSGGALCRLRTGAYSQMELISAAPGNQVSVIGYFNGGDGNIDSDFFFIRALTTWSGMGS